MTKIGENKYIFQDGEIVNCEGQFAKQGDTLSTLFREKLGCDLSKTKLLEILFELIISNCGNEFDTNGNAKRPVVQVLQKIIKLAEKNYQPVTQDTWQENQESGYFGEVVKK